MVQWIEKVNEWVGSLVWGPAMIVLMLLAGAYFTVGTGFFQFRRFGLWIRSTLGAIVRGGQVHDRDPHAISQFQALSTALAGTIGTGNIVGVATAIVAGGTGAVFWMWASALLGMMTKYAENVLGNLYRYRGKTGDWVGGPMVYIERGLHWKWLAVLFALFCAAASFGIGNMTQANSIAGALSDVFRIAPAAAGVAVATVSGVVILGGVRRVAAVTERLVPFMALFYMGGALIVLWSRRENIPQACGQIFAAAFDWQAGAGGIAGYGMAHAIRTGVSRGVFSNEAGLGSSVMVHTAADAKEPCEQGMWAVFEVFFDTIVMCTITALVILTSGVYNQTLYSLAVGTPLMDKLATGAQLTAAAFSTVFGPLGGGFVAVSLVLFAFSTLLGWSYYGQRAAEYLFGARAMPVYKALFVAAAIAGCTMRLDLAWALSDTFNGLMALPNLVGVLALRRETLREWRRYRRTNHI